MRALDDYLRGGWRSCTQELTAAGLGRSRLFSPGEPVLTHGVPGQHAALITSGLVKVTLPSADRLNGKAGTLLSIRGPGEFVGEETAILGEDAPAIAVGHDVDRFMVTALTDGQARVFPAEQLRRFLVEHPAVLWSVAAGLCERLIGAEARITSVARDNADCRLARLLCDLERHGDADYDGPVPAPRSRLSSARPSSPPGSAAAGQPSTGPSHAGAAAGSSLPGTALSLCTILKPLPA